MRETGKIFNFAIRQQTTDLIIGVIGINEVIDGTAEIGYWLSSQYWGRGVKPSCVKAFMEYITFRRSAYGIQTLQPCIFDTNSRSGRALEKCGFHFVENLKNYYVKNGENISAIRYQYSIETKQIENVSGDGVSFQQDEI